MDYITNGLFAILLLSIFYISGGANKMVAWYQIKRRQIKLLLSIVGKPKIVSFTVNDTDKSASIIYERLGQEYIILVPYQRSSVVTMSQFKVELIRSNKNPLDITQQPGIPYLITAHSLGGTAIKITNSETGQVHHYGEHTPPMYGVEVVHEE
jgi:hypothetical protein